MTHLTSQASSAIQALQHAFRLVDDLKSQPERDYAYAAIAAHLRSAAPMAFASLPVAGETEGK
jgi:hypothetical protein